MDDPVGEAAWQAALSIAIHKPHSLDKRVAGAVEVGRWEGELVAGPDPLTVQAVRETVRQGNCSQVLHDSLARQAAESGHGHCSSTEVRLQRLVGRQEGGGHHRLVISTPHWTEFLPLDSPGSAGYRLQLGPEKEGDGEEGEVVAAAGRGVVVRVSLAPECGAGQRAWVRDRLVPRLLGWARTNCTATSTSGSLRLVGLEEYSRQYRRLKDRYAASIIAGWTESSDPEKFVHEDIGIAAYLLELWRQQRQQEDWPPDKRQSFVDLGCGNGLLVFILCSEGHPGLGLDLRRRNIWDSFPASVELREQAVEAGLETAWPGKDWLLGNHSDELTPWLPIMAARSGASYWSLPCCPYSFSGKYQRRDGRKSVFRDHLDWLTELGEQAGFTVMEDRLRIPSTKRVCLVGRPCQPGPRSASLLAPLTAGPVTFTPRPKAEPVRNCTQVERGTVTAMVGRVAELCLQEERFLPGLSRHWNAGGCLGLGAVATRLQETGLDLSALAGECGGLQTLLRNQHSVFVVERGTVRLRVPGSDTTRQRRGKARPATELRVKTKPCWHHANHPHGCPLPAELCSWIHA